MKNILFLLLSLTLLAACKQGQKKRAEKSGAENEWDHSITGSFSGQVTLKLDSDRLDSFFSSYPDLKKQAKQVKQFYRDRQFALAWYDRGQVIEQAGNLANRVMNLENDGIYRTIPYQRELDSLIHEEAPNTRSPKPDLNLELMLTAQYFAFADMVYNGVDATTSIASGWNVPRKKLDYKTYLDSLLSTSPKQTAQEPVYRQYKLLKKFLAKYRTIDAMGQWKPIVSAKLKAGDSSHAVSLIKQRLFLLGDYNGDTTGIHYDDALQASVKAFQSRHGLSINGTVDASTLAALNVPLKQRIVQILVNMERSRWLPVSLNSYYLAVNIPEFKLHVYHADSLLWSCKVVVGQTVHPTTIFSGNVRYVVFSPYWNIPPSIVRNEVLPGIKRNANYLRTHRMEITGKEDGLPTIRQLPGESNSLGLVKFLFPNTYNIYLHDTPSRSLFGETTRAFSHGCIRVSQPARLAAFLLADSSKWNQAMIDKAMHTGKERTVTLKNKIPVFIAYFTAFIDRENKINFRKDIYNLDDRLADALIRVQ
ncbi:murein L,D-transpeptidase [Mucilaginibacter sp. AW1-3]